MIEYVGDFLIIFILYMLTPFFWISIIGLVFWILFIGYLKKKSHEKMKVFLNILGSIIGTLIIIGAPLAISLLNIFSHPISFM